MWCGSSQNRTTVVLASAKSGHIDYGMASRSEPWLDEDEPAVVPRVPIALSVALEVVAELRERARERHRDRPEEVDGPIPASSTTKRQRL